MAVPNAPLPAGTRQLRPGPAVPSPPSLPFALPVQSVQTLRKVTLLSALGVEREGRVERKRKRKARAPLCSDPGTTGNFFFFLKNHFNKARRPEG